MSRFVPLYERIKDQIYTDILEARVDGSGTRLPTERELQIRYQVSRPTISKALAALAAEGLLTKSQGRGTFALSPPHTDNHTVSPPRRIGFVAPISGAELVQRAFRGVDRVAHRQGYYVLMGSAGHVVERERASVRELIASGARGLVIYPVPRRGDQHRDDYLRTEKFDVPIVLMDTCVPEQGHTQVIFDNRRACQAMTAWLIGKGHRRIGLLCYDEEVRHASLAARVKGYLDALRDHGLPVDQRLVFRYNPDQQPVGIAAALDEWLDLTNPPTAIIAPEDHAALETIQQLTARGVRVPDDVRVTGFDDRQEARHFRPAFATTHPDFERMGEFATDLLLDLMQNNTVFPGIYVLEVPLLTRRSSDSPTVAAFVREAAAR